MKLFGGTSVCFYPNTNYSTDLMMTRRKYFTWKAVACVRLMHVIGCAADARAHFHVDVRKMYAPCLTSIYVHTAAKQVLRRGLEPLMFGWLMSGIVRRRERE
jgi:hypothetical protein